MLDGRDSSQLAIPHVRVRDQRLYQTIGLLGRQVRNTLTNSKLPLISILCLFSEFLFYLSFWPKTTADSASPITCPRTISLGVSLKFATRQGKVSR